MNQEKGDAQRIIEIVNKMTKVKASSNDSAQELVKYYLDSVLGVQNFDELQGDECAQQVFLAFQDLFEKTQILSQRVVDLRKKASSMAESSQAASGAGRNSLNFTQMITAQRAIIKIQAWWKKESTLRRLQKEIRDTKAALTMRKELESPEETALREFAQQLQNKRLSPEAFFRLCDIDYKQAVRVSVFKEQLQKLGIQLSRGQQSRLIMILDEDMEGNITREEFYNALEAYNVSGEKHKSIDGSLYHPFEHRCLFKLISDLKTKDITFLEMFNACDVNDDARVSISEIRRFVEGLSPDFKQKELHALMNYLDIDKNGLVDKDEFLRQLTRGEQTFKQSQIINKQMADRKALTTSSSNKAMMRPQENNFFEEEIVGEGDQAFFSGVMDKVFGKKEEPAKATTQKQTAQDKPPVKGGSSAQQQRPNTQGQLLAPDQQKRKAIIEKMEKEGLNFQSFFNSIKGLSTGGLIPLGGLLKAMEASYPTLASVDRQFLIKECIADRGKVDYIQLEELFTKFSKNLKPSVSQSFSIIANNIVKRMGGSPQDSIRQFFKAQNMSETDAIGDIEFTQMFSGKFSALSSRELEQAFNSMNVDMDGFVQVRDLIEVLLSYTNSTDKVSINVKELSSIIPGFESMSPRTRCEEVIEYILGELKKKNLKPLNVYKMADAKNSGGVQATLLEITFKKILPHIKNEIFQEAFYAFKLQSSRDIISRKDFETVFNDDPSSQYVPHSAAVTGKKTMTESASQMRVTQSAGANQDSSIENENIKWIKKLDNAMLRQGISPGVAFKAADINHNNVVTVDELRDSIKKLIPDDEISLVELKKVMLAFDSNQNGLIDEQEFISLIEKARNSTVTVVESPQKGRILKDDMPAERRSQLPVKDQMRDRRQQVDYSQDISLIVDQLDKRITLKRVFGDILINEEGKMMTNQVSRRLKAEQPSDGSTLKPAEYLPIVKFLDSQSKGVIEIKDVMKFLEKYCKSNTYDCTLELKYIANFIEFQMKNRNTRQFLETNTKLKAGTRILEVDVMTELSKIFSIPITSGGLVYKTLCQIKGNTNVTLDDLSKLIDDYRVVKIDYAAQQASKVQTEAQKLDPNETLNKFITSVTSLTKRKQEMINERLIEINQRDGLIPYPDFFELFVDDYQLLSSKESKNVFQSMKPATGNVNGIVLKDFQQRLQWIQPAKVEPPSAQQKPNQQNLQKPQAQVNLNDSINDREITSPQAIIQLIEQQAKTPFENIIEDFFNSEQIPTIQFQRKILQAVPNFDKSLLSKLFSELDKARQGKMQMNDVIMMLKEIKGKYDSDQVIKSIASQIKDPITRTLEEQGITDSESYFKSDFVDIITSITQVSKFQCLCLFYDLCGQGDEIQGKAFISKVQAIKQSLQRKPTGKAVEEQKKPAAAVQDKKTVSFQQKTSDSQQVQNMCNFFVKNSAKIIANDQISNALNKISQYMKQFKTQQQAQQALDPTGNGLMKIDELKAKLDEAGNFSNEEKFVLCFIPINQNKNDIIEINIANYVRYLRQLTVDQPTINQNKEILNANLQAVKKYLAGGEFFEEAKPETGTQNVAPMNARESKAEMKRQKKMEKMKDIIAGLRSAFKDPKKRQGLIDVFTQAPKQKLSYSDFYDYVDTFGIQASDDQWEIFQNQVDIYTKLKFRFIDFVEFCKKYEIDFKSDLVKGATIAVDARDLNGEKLNCGLLTYNIVPERDYYKGIPTILNSEEAAIVVAEKIYKSIKEDEEFFDMDFGPKNDDDKEGSSLSMYCTGKPPPGYIDPEQIAWLRPEDMTDKVPQFIDDGAGSNDVKQGKLGDCWFIGALSVLATRDELLRGGIGNIVVTNDFEADEATAQKFCKGVYPPLFHLYRRKGLYVFRFFKEFQWRYVLIDDRLPCFEYSKKPVFGSCTNLHELWVPLIEKAYAKLHGCYESLISGYIDDALHELTGYVAEKLSLHNEQKVFPHKNIGTVDQFWEFLMQRVKEKCMMGCSVVGDVEREIIIDGQKAGIMTGHAYGLIDAFELQDPDMAKPRKTHRILRVRNPWGAMEWKGKWGDKSDEIDTYKHLLDKYIASIEDDDERFEPGVEDGTFLINYASWRDIYNNMYICVDFPDSWNGIRFKSEWNQACSGGVPSPMTPENLKRWAKNPQFYFAAEKDVELFISLVQPDGRGKREDGRYLKFPYSEVIHPVIFSVFELPKGKKAMEIFDKNLVRAQSVLKEHKEISVRKKLPKGNYVIVPTTRNPGEYGPFTLSIYFNLAMKDVTIYRIDEPENEFEPIWEESEAAEQCAEWKIDLCQKRIKFMMLEEDEGINDSLMKSGMGSPMGSGPIKLSEALNKKTMKKKTDSPQKDFSYNEAFPDDESIT